MSTKKNKQPNIFLGQRIRTIRKTLRLNQAEFAKPLMIKGASISEYETGRVTPPERMQHQICVQYRVNQIWLETGEGSMFMDPGPPPHHYTQSDEKQTIGDQKPTECCIPKPEYFARNSGRTELHRMLDEILESGENNTIRAITSNIIEFNEKVKEREAFRKRLEALEEKVYNSWD